MAIQKRPLFDPPIVARALRDAVRKLGPRHMVRNPVMFVVLIGSIYTTVVLTRDIALGTPDWGFTLQLAIWLWFTVLFANFAEAMAEGRGKAQAETLRRSRTSTMAKRLAHSSDRHQHESVAASALRRGASSSVFQATYSRRRRSHRRRGVGRRVGNHRRVRSGRARVGW